MFIKVLLVLLAGLNGFSLVQPNREAALKKQVNLYYSAFSEGNYNKMWKMSSAHFHQRNDNNKAAYIAYLRKAGSVKAKVTIKSISITSTRARVVLMISLRSNSDGKWYDEEQRNVWVFENGRWLFDRQNEENM